MKDAIPPLQAVYDKRKRRLMKLLGLPTRLIGAVGQDINGRMIKENALLNKIDMDDSLIVKNKKTSTYLYVLDEKGELIDELIHYTK